MAAKNFNIIIHMPKTAEGKAELEHRVAQLHAESVLKHVNLCGIIVHQHIYYYIESKNHIKCQTY